MAKLLPLINRFGTLVDRPSDPAKLFAMAIESLIEETAGQMYADFDEQMKTLRTQVAGLMRKQSETLHQIGNAIIRSESQLTQAITSIRELSYSHQALEKQVRVVCGQVKLWDNLGQENRLLGQEHYRRCIVEPMVRSLFPIFDFVESAAASKDKNEPNAHNAQKELAEAVKVQLEQFFLAYEIEPVKHKAMNEFNPRMMKPIRTIPTHNAQINSRVAESLQTGFAWRKELLLRLESVGIYKHQLRS